MKGLLKPIMFCLNQFKIVNEQGEDLDFAYDSISAFSSSRDNQEAVLWLLSLVFLIEFIAIK